MSNKNKINFNEKIVADFYNQYLREFDFYNAASLLAAQLIEAQLISKGIRAIVTFRAKNPSRLHDKIAKRAIEENKNYKNLEDIYQDVVDLAGVRIALYFNSERDEIEQIINDIFTVHKKKEFPTEGKSQGYKATHYRANIKENSLTEQQKRYSNANVEIQVASLLMHAWAEVEHDIVYKPLQGKVSEAEQKALDELNFIVLKGEETLKKLQQATYKRNSFNDHYDLYSFLIQYVSEKYNIKEEQAFIGDIKKLYDYLLDNKIDTQNKLKNKIKDFNIIIDENWTLSDQIMDYIAGNYKVKYRSYLDNTTYKIKKDISTENAVGKFIFAWIELEKILKNNDMATSYKDTFIRLKSLVNLGILSEDEYEKVYKIRSVRNNLVHGIEMPDNDYLDWYTKEIKELTQSLKDKSHKKMMDRAVDEIALSNE
jgi:ppGpp synthetase/RelA/SpoT-type nucleotidyltranferase